MIKVGYSVNDKIIFSGISAWENILSEKSRNNLHNFYLYLNNDVYDNVLWHQRPERSIADYEVDHAHKLREMYDYIRIWYSGGSDSHSVVEAFLRAGINIDEISTVSWKVLENFDTGSADNEILVMKMLKDLFEKYNRPLPKISIARVEKSHIDQHFQKNFFYNHIGYGGNFSYNCNQHFEIAKFVDPPPVSNYCEVFGIEKPRLTIEGQKIYFQMNDKSIMHAANTHESVEWFYLPRMTPDLIRAQIWAVLDYATRSSAPWTTINQLQTKEEWYHTWCSLLGRTTSITQNVLAFKSKNIGTSLPVNNRHRYRHVTSAESSNDTSWKNYVGFVKYNQELAKLWGDSFDLLPGIYSKKYFLMEI
jgi:hypothetical protein